MQDAWASFGGGEVCHLAADQDQKEEHDACVWGAAVGHIIYFGNQRNLTLYMLDWAMLRMSVRRMHFHKHDFEADRLNW